MTFACTNYDYNTDTCQKLRTDCIPGRPGCVLEGKVKLSEELQKRIAGVARKRTPAKGKGTGAGRKKS
ncbi:MAG: hypothetical protein ACOY8P_06760 [Thermodesulfobacteriota bacterium]